MFKHTRPLTALVAGITLVGTVALAAPAQAAPATQATNQAYTIRATYPSGAYVIKQVPIGTSTTTALVGAKRMTVPNKWRVTVTNQVQQHTNVAAQRIATATVDFYTAQYLRQRFTTATSSQDARQLHSTVGSAEQAQSIYRGAMFTAKYAAQTLYNRQVRTELSQQDATRLLQQTTAYLARHTTSGEAALRAASKKLSLSTVYTGTFKISGQAGVIGNKSLAGYRSISVSVTSNVDAVTWYATAYATGAKRLTFARL